MGVSRLLNSCAITAAMVPMVARRWLSVSCWRMYSICCWAASSWRSRVSSIAVEGCGCWDLSLTLRELSAQATGVHYLPRPALFDGEYRTGGAPRVRVCVRASRGIRAGAALWPGVERRRSFGNAPGSLIGAPATARERHQAQRAGEHQAAGGLGDDHEI